jgi:hypothetical protein
VVRGGGAARFARRLLLGRLDIGVRGDGFTRRREGRGEDEWEGRLGNVSHPFRVFRAFRGSAGGGGDGPRNTRKDTKGGRVAGVSERRGLLAVCVWGDWTSAFAGMGSRGGAKDAEKTNGREGLRTCRIPFVCFVHFVVQQVAGKTVHEIHERTRKEGVWRVYRSGEVCAPFAFGAIGHRRSRGWVHAEARRTQRRRMGGEAWERVASLSCVSCLSWFSRWRGRRSTKHTKGHEKGRVVRGVGAARFARRLLLGRLDIGVRG